MFHFRSWMRWVTCSLETFSSPHKPDRSLVTLRCSFGGVLCFFMNRRKSVCVERTAVVVWNKPDQDCRTVTKCFLKVWSVLKSYHSYESFRKTWNTVPFVVLFCLCCVTSLTRAMPFIRQVSYHLQLSFQGFCAIWWSCVPPLSLSASAGPFIFETEMTHQAVTDHDQCCTNSLQLPLFHPAVQKLSQIQRGTGDTDLHHTCVITFHSAQPL